MAPPVVKRSLTILGATWLLVACAGSQPADPLWRPPDPQTGSAATITPPPPPSPTATVSAPSVEELFVTPLPAGVARPSPTPDPVRQPPVLRTEQELYVVQPGDSLGVIGAQFNVGAGQIMQANGLLNPDVLFVGQTLLIPPPQPLPPGPSSKIIPDSELVYGPSTLFLDTQAEIERWSGPLPGYQEEVDGELMTGPQIVEYVARQYSVNPRLLLALLEYQGGFLTQPQSPDLLGGDLFGLADPMRYGLYRQLSFAADQLNQGFYLWRAGWSGPFLLPDGRIVPPGGGINAGTAGVQQLFSQIRSHEAWLSALAEDGFAATYRQLFGDPFEWAIEPLLPEDLIQPLLQLPFEPDAVWSFTSGPHAAWGNGSAWAALDFAPPGFALGCVQSQAWVTAVAAGPIVRTDLGVVVQDLDGDGNESTGWNVLYLHVESRERVQAGDVLQPGDRIGHPSCEGGFANGTHLHLARKYNGVWIEADGGWPFVMDGWVSAGGGQAYDGTLSRAGVTREACSCRDDFNQIQR